LLLHLFVSVVNCNHMAYLSLMPKGDIRIVTALAPNLPKAPSHYTCHGISITGPSV
jgi:hypothetical protein